MRFKKGDKVWMVSKARCSISIPSMRGTVIAINKYSYDKPKMMVELENGDRVIQDVDECIDSIVAFKPDFRVISSSGRATGF